MQQAATIFFKDPGMEAVPRPGLGEQVDLGLELALFIVSQQWLARHQLAADHTQLGIHL